MLAESFGAKMVDNYYNQALINITKHPATPEQRAAGVFDVPDSYRQRLIYLLTFEKLPSTAEVEERAKSLAREFYTGQGWYLIGGSPYLMGPLERAINALGGRAFYAFFIRKSFKTVGPDGMVVKTSVFKHGGFIQAVGGGVPPTDKPKPW